MKFNTIEELLHYTEAIKGRTFKEIDSEHLLENTTNLKRNKGILGHVVESGFYKYPINSNPQADFDKIGVELKVTGYKKNKKGGMLQNTGCAVTEMSNVISSVTGNDVTPKTINTNKVIILDELIPFLNNLIIPNSNTISHMATIRLQ